MRGGGGGRGRVIKKSQHQIILWNGVSYPITRKELRKASAF